MKRESSGPILTAVFVDYDNIYLSLRRKSEDAAKRFAKDAGTWIKEIETGSLITATNAPASTIQRRLVMNRCYGNPVPRRNQSDNSTDMSSFPFVRHHFLRSGFEVVDCPPLTQQLKNSADIRMVMDIRDYLTHETYFDEFVILSGDADFTPLLHRLRAHARRTVIFANDHTAAPYTAISDGEVRESALLALLLGNRVGETERVQIADQSQAADPEVTRQQIVAEVVKAVREAPQPVPLEALAERAMRVLGHERTAGSNWGGVGSFRELLLADLPPAVRLTDAPPYLAFDVARAEARLAETRSAEARLAEARPVEARPADGRPGEPLPLEARQPEPRAPEPRPAIMSAPTPAAAAQASAAPAPLDARLADGAPPFGARLLAAGPTGSASPTAAGGSNAGMMAAAPQAIAPAPAAPMAPAPAAPVPAAHAMPAHTAPAPSSPAQAQAHIQAQAPAQVQAPAIPPQRSAEAAAALQRSISRIHEACQAPPLAPPEYRALFDIIGTEITQNQLLGAQTITNILTRAQELGIGVRRDDVKFVLDVVSEADPWFDQGASPVVLAGRFRNFVVARCRSQGLSLTADELDLIEAWFVSSAAVAPSQQRPATAQQTGAQAAYPAQSQPQPQPAAPRAGAWWGETAPAAAFETAPVPGQQVAFQQQPAQAAGTPASPEPAYGEGDEFPRIVRSRLRG